VKQSVYIDPWIAPGMSSCLPQVVSNQPVDQPLNQSFG
jgi:hypothetical protein